MNWLKGIDFKKEFERKFIEQLRFDPEAVYRDIEDLIERANNGDTEAEDNVRVLEQMYPLAHLTLIHDGVRDQITPLIEAIRDSINDSQQGDSD